MSLEQNITSSFLFLSKEVADLYPDNVQQINGYPDPLSFYRRYVAQNRPVIIKHAIDHWPALRKWNSAYFRERIGQTKVTVAVTPNGYADAICGDRFVMPEERHMNMSQFLDILDEHSETRKEKEVFYIQKQNSNLTDEFAELMKDVDPHLEWGTQAFGSKPDAVNFWMGDAKAVTSLHKDPYENLYCVVSGMKTFTLYPPTDLPFLPYEQHRAACYEKNTDGNFEIVDQDEDSIVPWIAVDPLRPDYERFPQFAQARSITVEVKAGEILYLPSLWFHHVQQTQACIAVNYWHDMEFDMKWAYSQFLEHLVKQSS